MTIKDPELCTTCTHYRLGLCVLSDVAYDDFSPGGSRREYSRKWIHATEMKGSCCRRRPRRMYDREGARR